MCLPALFGQSYVDRTDNRLRCSIRLFHGQKVVGSPRSRQESRKKKRLNRHFAPANGKRCGSDKLIPEAHFSVGFSPGFFTSGIVSQPLREKGSTRAWRTTSPGAGWCPLGTPSALFSSNRTTSRRRHKSSGEQDRCCSCSGWARATKSFGSAQLVHEYGRLPVAPVEDLPIV